MSGVIFDENADIGLLPVEPLDWKGHHPPINAYTLETMIRAFITPLNRLYLSDSVYSGFDLIYYKNILDDGHFYDYAPLGERRDCDDYAVMASGWIHQFMGGAPFGEVWMLGPPNHAMNILAAYQREALDVFLYDAQYNRFYSGPALNYKAYLIKI